MESFVCFVIKIYSSVIYVFTKFGGKCAWASLIVASRPGSRRQINFENKLNFAEIEATLEHLNSCMPLDRQTFQRGFFFFSTIIKVSQPLLIEFRCSAKDFWLTRTSLLVRNLYYWWVGPEHSMQNIHEWLKISNFAALRKSKKRFNWISKWKDFFEAQSNSQTLASSPSRSRFSSIWKQARKNRALKTVSAHHQKCFWSKSHKKTQTAKRERKSRTFGNGCEEAERF